MQEFDSNRQLSFQIGADGNLVSALKCFGLVIVRTFFILQVFLQPNIFMDSSCGMLPHLHGKKDLRNYPEKNLGKILYLLHDKNPRNLPAYWSATISINHVCLEASNWSTLTQISPTVTATVSISFSPISCSPAGYVQEGRGVPS